MKQWTICTMGTILRDNRPLTINTTVRDNCYHCKRQLVQFARQLLQFARQLVQFARQLVPLLSTIDNVVPECGRVSRLHLVRLWPGRDPGVLLDYQRSRGHLVAELVGRVTSVVTRVEEFDVSVTKQILAH